MPRAPMLSPGISFALCLIAVAVISWLVYTLWCAAVAFSEERKERRRNKKDQ